MDAYEEILAEDEESKWVWVNPVTLLLGFVASYGWYLVGAGAVLLYVYNKLRPALDKWREAREDAEYHKDPDKALARMEATQRARERQQRALIAASERALELQKQREEQKRQENIERLEKYGAAGGGRKLGTPADGDYLPLSGGASTSSYKPPKRSACKGGGCGK